MKLIYIGLTEIRRNFSKNNYFLDKKIEINYVKPFPPGLYKSILSLPNISKVTIFECKKEMRKKLEIKHNANIVAIIL